MLLCRLAEQLASIVICPGPAVPVFCAMPVFPAGFAIVPLKDFSGGSLPPAFFAILLFFSEKLLLPIISQH
jgi:hypothetical protein